MRHWYRMLAEFKPSSKQNRWTTHNSRYIMISKVAEHERDWRTTNIHRCSNERENCRETISPQKYIIDKIIQNNAIGWFRRHSYVRPSTSQRSLMYSQRWKLQGKCNTHRFDDPLKQLSSISYLRRLPLNFHNKSTFEKNTPFFEIDATIEGKPIFHWMMSSASTVTQEEPSKTLETYWVLSSLARCYGHISWGEK